MKKMGVDSDDGGTTTRGGLRKHELGRQYSDPGTDGVQGTPDDVYTTNYKRDSTSVVAIDPDSDGVPDVVIVGTRKDLDYVACCGDAGKVHDITAATGGGTLDAYDTETIAAAKFRPPLNPSTVDLAGGESVVITVVFGTINRDNEVSGMADVYMTIESAQRYGTPIDGLVASTEVLEGPDGVLGTDDDVTITVTAGAFNERDDTMAETGTTKLFTDELRQNRLPGSEKDDEKRHATHTVQFVEIPNSIFDDTGTSPATPGVRNHLYIGFHNQQVNLETDTTTNINHKLILGNYYPAPTDAEMHPSTVGDDDLEYKYDSTDPGSKMQYIYDPNGVHSKLAIQMRGMDVVIPDAASAQWRDTVPSVHMLTNGGTVLEIRPGLVGETTVQPGPDGTLGTADDVTIVVNRKLLYDAADATNDKSDPDGNVGPDSIKLGLLRTDGTTEDLTNVNTPDRGDMRDADYSAGLVVVADFDGDTYPDVLSGRHISYNTAAAGTQGHSDAHPGQRGIYDGLPKEWWTFGVTPSAVEAFDADGDGDMDLIVAPRGFSNGNTNVVPSDAESTTSPLVQILLNDGSGDFSRAERRAMLMATFKDGDDNLPAAVRMGAALKITTGHLNPDEDAREDLVFIVGSNPDVGGYAVAYVSDSGGASDADRAHMFELVNLRTGAQSSANNMYDVLVTSLTGVAATDATRRPLQDIVLLEDTGNVHLIPGTAFAGTAAAMTDGTSYQTKETAIQGTTVTVAVPPDTGTLKKLDVGYVLRNGPGGASSGFLRDDGVGGSELPLRKSGIDSSGTPTDTDADDGDTLQVAIVGQTDNAGVIRDELEPELRTPDIVLAGTTEVWMLSPGSLIRDVSTRYASATPEKLFTYASGTNTPRTPTSIQVRDSDRNGLDDILLSFKKNDGVDSNEIYRSIIYTYTNFGTTKEDSETLRDTCAGNPRAANCDRYLGPKEAEDLRFEEKTLSKAGSATPDNGDGTIKMVVEDVDLDGYYDVIYAVEFSEGARVNLARKEHVDGQPSGTSTADKTTTDTYLTHSEKPQQTNTEIENIRTQMGNWLDSLLSSHETTPTVLGVTEDITDDQELYTGEDRFGIVNRGASGTHDPSLQPQQIVPDPNGMNYVTYPVGGDDGHLESDHFATASDEIGGNYVLPNRAGAVSRQMCPVPKETVTPIQLSFQIDFERLAQTQTTDQSTSRSYTHADMEFVRVAADGSVPPPGLPRLRPAVPAANVGRADSDGERQHAADVRLLGREDLALGAAARSLAAA